MECTKSIAGLDKISELLDGCKQKAACGESEAFLPGLVTTISSLNENTKLLFEILTKVASLCCRRDYQAKECWRTAIVAIFEKTCFLGDQELLTRECHS